MIIHGPLRPCRDCGALAGQPCADDCPSAAAAHAEQVAIELDNAENVCRCTYPLCGHRSRAA